LRSLLWLTTEEERCAGNEQKHKRDEGEQDVERQPAREKEYVVLGALIPGASDNVP